MRRIIEQLTFSCKYFSFFFTHVLCSPPAPFPVRRQCIQMEKFDGTDNTIPSKNTRVAGSGIRLTGSGANPSEKNLTLEKKLDSNLTKKVDPKKTWQSEKRTDFI